MSEVLGTFGPCCFLLLLPTTSLPCVTCRGLVHNLRRGTSRTLARAAFGIFSISVVSPETYAAHDERLLLSEAAPILVDRPSSRLCLKVIPMSLFAAYPLVSSIVQRPSS